MKPLHAMRRHFLLSAFFLAAANVCVAQTPMMSGASGDSDSAEAGPAVRIVEPAEGETVHNNNGSMIVRLEEESAFAGGIVELLLDGNPVAASRDGDTFIVSGVERGTHNLQARSIGKNGETAQSDPVTFNLWQASAIFRRSAP